MSFFLSRIKAIFIIALAFPLHSAETAFVPSPAIRMTLDCNVYKDQLHFCTKEMDPICGANGKTYNNKCIFCSEMLEHGGAFEFSHYGRC